MLLPRPQFRSSSATLKMAFATPQVVQLLNLAYFGRPADPHSLNAWQAAGQTASQVVAAFVKDEFVQNTLTQTVR